MRIIIGDRAKFTEEEVEDLILELLDDMKVNLRISPAIYLEDEKDLYERRGVLGYNYYPVGVGGVSWNKDSLYWNLYFSFDSSDYEDVNDDYDEDYDNPDDINEEVVHKTPFDPKEITDFFNKSTRIKSLFNIIKIFRDVTGTLCVILEQK